MAFNFYVYDHKQEKVVHVEMGATAFVLTFEKDWVKPEHDIYMELDTADSRFKWKIFAESTKQWKWLQPPKIVKMHAILMG